MVEHVEIITQLWAKCLLSAVLVAVGKIQENV